MAKCEICSVHFKRCFFITQLFIFSKIQWDRNGKIIGSDYDVQYTNQSPVYKRSISQKFQFNKSKKRSKRGFMSNEEGVLIIDNVDADENGGLYTCLVSNPSGESARRSFELVVVVPPILEEFSFGSNLQEGQNAQATCSVRIGDTPIFFSWLKDGSPISGSLKVRKIPK